ncbi:MAG: glycosyltransferase [Verrucomicrobia bacterium]|nr:MAG: glycosyltransferase [Verrucomicrobiota bacterium]TAE87367.1 MAG: glycosyltransferase [Verrucomicrobiota bacterium]TAF25222.1 MAG: glycosyltransferase [Verrucomicrobiota bacterium]TAF40868.1 MAG: glycosyltransferase [Verrucomicrobiota bacterium]
MTPPVLDTKAPSASAPRVLYSFPHRIGAGQICHTAWQQVIGLQQAGVEVILATGSVARPLPAGISVRKTLSAGSFRLPVRLLGRLKACALHDWRVARMLPALKGKIDLIHAWPIGALHTIRAAKKLGIPVVLERPNAHTRFAFKVVAEECERLGFRLPPGHEHEFNQTTLAREEAEYAEADALLCPSEFVARSFIELGFAPEKLLRHRYGYDDSKFSPPSVAASPADGLTMIYAGGCAPRKGLHHALRAWLDSGAAERGKFLVAGGFVEGYAELLKDMLEHPSVEVLGHRNDLDVLMRKSDLFVLSTVEEGSALVTYEARASGCVLLVSDASGAVCDHLDNGLIHRAGDVAELTRHIRLLDQDRAMLERLRRASLASTGSLSWTAAGPVLKSAYVTAVASYGGISRTVTSRFSSPQLSPTPPCPCPQTPSPC